MAGVRHVLPARQVNEAISLLSLHSQSVVMGLALSAEIFASRKQGYGRCSCLMFRRSSDERKTHARISSKVVFEDEFTRSGQLAWQRYEQDGLVRHSHVC